MAGLGILAAAWGASQGTVFISTRDEDKQWVDHPFEWPSQRKEILQCIEQNRDKDLYWAPAVFSADRRLKENVTEPVRTLWADLDAVSPASCFIPPSIAWESSPGRYHALWLMEKPLLPPDAEELNKRLTYATGADKSGWILNKVLRIPGTINYKYVEKPTVKLLWAKKNYVNPQSLAKQLPPAQNASATAIDTIEIGNSGALRDLVWPYRKVIGEDIWQLLFTPDDVVDDDDRSKRIFDLECRLLNSGLPVMDVLKIAKASPWNKYKGRADEDKRLLTEVLKAEKQVRTSPVLDTETGDLPWMPYANFLGMKLTAPGWLVEDIWQAGSCGAIAGEAKTYKSLISTELAVSVASGLPMWDVHKVTAAGPVLIIQEENPAWLMQDRLIKIAHSKGLLDGEAYYNGPNLMVEFPKSLPLKVCNNFGFDLTSDAHKASLVREIERLRPVLVILDPLYLMLGPLDDNSSQELRGLLQWLLKLRDDYKTSIMAIHHWNKGGKGSTMGQRILGSVAWDAWVESYLGTSLRDEESNEVVIGRRFRAYGKLHDLGFKCKMSDPGTDPSYEVQVYKADSAARHSNDMDVMDYIRTNGSVSKGDLAGFTGLTKPGVEKIVKRLIEKGWLEQDTGQKGRGHQTMYKTTEVGRAESLKKTEQTDEKVS